LGIGKAMFQHFYLYFSIPELLLLLSQVGISISWMRKQIQITSGTRAKIIVESEVEQ
jgi:hypothetical protein